MSDQTDKLISLLTPFGLSDMEARIYLHLSAKGSTSALQLSRELRVARTRVYRILDKLIFIGLVSQKLQGRGLKFIAQAPKQLELLIKQKEHETENLRQSAKLIYDQLANLSRLSSPKSNVLYYSGIEGLKQVTWNTLRAKKELLIYELKDMSAFLDYGFCEQVRQEFINRKIKVRELTNSRQLPGWTKVKKLVKQYWRCRYLDPKLLKIKSEVLIYNNVYVIYSYKENDIFCVEIYNQDLAQMQKHIFDFFWNQAKVMKITSDEGSASVTKN